MNNYEEGLIGQYVDKVQALAVRAEQGEDVKAAVTATVNEACEHFRIVKTSDPQANLAAFRGRLQIAAEGAHASQPIFKRTLLDAANACPAQI